MNASSAFAPRSKMVRMYRKSSPFPSDALVEACARASRVGVLDRDYAAGIGGVWAQDVRAAFQGRRDGLLVQGYLTGIGGGDVTVERVGAVLDDLRRRELSGDPVWIDLHDPAPVPAPRPPTATVVTASTDRTAEPHVHPSPGAAEVQP